MALRQLRALRDSLNPDGTVKLGRILDCSERTVRNKMSGTTKIKAGDLALIEAARKQNPARKG
jgi:hypothetical protein